MAMKKVYSTVHSTVCFALYNNFEKVYWHDKRQKYKIKIFKAWQKTKISQLMWSDMIWSDVHLTWSTRLSWTITNENAHKIKSRLLYNTRWACMKCLDNVIKKKPEKNTFGNYFIQKHKEISQENDRPTC